MAGADTTLSEGQSRFPQTAWTLVERLRDPRNPEVRECLERLADSYWRPVYKYIRIAWKRSNEDSKDLTQAFFVRLMEGDLLARADREKGNFRKFLLVSLKNFLANDARDAKAVKRGGRLKIVSLDDDALDPEDPQAGFEAQWGKELLNHAIERMEGRVRSEAYQAFRQFHLEGIPVKQIASDLGANQNKVGHWLQAARTELRSLVTEEIRQYVKDESEIPRELDVLFGGWK